MGATATAGAAATPGTGPDTTRAAAHPGAVDARRIETARAIGAAMAASVHDPEAVATTLRGGLAGLADAAYLAGQRRVAPGIGPIHGVRAPLLAAVASTFRGSTRDDRATTLLFVADRLIREEHLEARWIAFGMLERTLPGDPERTWQLLRRAARTAADWITVDTLARPYAAGVALEPYRWSELEQLIYSPSPWERRLIGSTIATLSHGRYRRRLGADVIGHGLPLLASLIGDDGGDVQKALAWAYRSLAALDRPAVTAALRAEAETARATDDGHRAWVVRDALSKLDPVDAQSLRDRLAGVRRRSDTPATSTAAAAAAAFGGLPDPAVHPEPPLI